MAHHKALESLKESAPKDLYKQQRELKKDRLEKLNTISKTFKPKYHTLTEKKAKLKIELAAQRNEIFFELRGTFISARMQYIDDFASSEYVCVLAVRLCDKR